MEYHWLVPLTAAVANAFLATLVNRKGQHSPLHQVFTFLAVSLVFWNLIYVVLYSVKDVGLASQLASLYRSGGLFLFPAVLHLCVALPNRPRSRTLSNLVWLDYLFAVGFVLGNAMGLLVTRLHRVHWGYYSSGTTIYDLFSVYVIINFAAAFLLLIYELRTSQEPRTRLQLKFWLLAMAVSLPLGLTNLLPVYGVDVYPIGNLGSAAWAAVVAYAIVRHRLMDVELAVTKGISYLAVLLGLVGPALIASIWMQRWAFGRVNSDFTAALFVLMSTIGVLFPVLLDKTEARLQKSLFAQKRESRAMLADFSRALLKILDPERLTRELCIAINSGLNLDSTAVFMWNERNSKFSADSICGAKPRDVIFSARDSFVEWLRSEGQAVLAEESHGAKVGEIKLTDVFSRNAWHVCMPLIAGESLLGFVALGKKQNLDAFSVADLDALSGVAAQASIALENARLYAQLRKSEEIINRTDRLSALGTLAAGIAHEIRNPLVSIQTFFQLAPERLGDAEFRESFLNLAAGEVSRIRDLVGELLSYARSTSPTIRDINIGELIARVSTLMIPHAKKRDVNIICESEDPTISVEADGDQLTQVLINVMLNAVQAAPQGGVVSILAGSGPDHEFHLCRIRVEDNGPGVPEDLRDSIFNPFFTTKEAGTGLGLSIAHRIVSDYGGYIRVGQGRNGGGAFEILLPKVGNVQKLAG